SANNYYSVSRCWKPAPIKPPAMPATAMRPYQRTLPNRPPSGKMMTCCAPSAPKHDMKFSRLVRRCSASMKGVTVNAVAAVPILAKSACRRYLTQRFALNVQRRRNNSAYKNPLQYFTAGFLCADILITAEHLLHFFQFAIRHQIQFRKALWFK